MANSEETPPALRVSAPDLLRARYEDPRDVRWQDTPVWQADRKHAPYATDPEFLRRMQEERSMPIPYLTPTDALKWMFKHLGVSASHFAPQSIAATTRLYDPALWRCRSPLKLYQLTHDRVSGRPEVFLLDVFDVPARTVETFSDYLDELYAHIQEGVVLEDCLNKTLYLRDKVKP